MLTQQAECVVTCEEDGSLKEMSMLHISSVCMCEEHRTWGRATAGHLCSPNFVLNPALCAFCWPPKWQRCSPAAASSCLTWHDCCADVCRPSPTCALVGLCWTWQQWRWTPRPRVQQAGCPSNTAVCCHTQQCCCMPGMCLRSRPQLYTAGGTAAAIASN